MMTPPTREQRLIRSSEDVTLVRRLVRSHSVALGFSLIDQTKLVTAASELARNALEHGGGGFMELEHVIDRARRGLKLTFVDEGPGIADVSQAMRDGYTTGSGLGLGLGGAKRLSGDFNIESTPGKGTRVAITRWK
jgi:serine/threonine-protein kinase RsbT